MLAGILSDNRFSNPLTRLNNSFSTRDYRSQETEEESLMLIHFSQEKVLVYLEELNILFLKEKGLDSSSNMTALIIISSYLPVLQESKYNFSFIYPVSKRLQLKLGFVRGNTLNFGFSYAANFSGRDPIVKKTTPLQ